MTVVLGVCVIALGALLAVGWVVAVADSAPNLDQLKPRNPAPLSQVFAADGTSLGYIQSDTAFSAVAPNQLPNRLEQATVAIEDRRFWHHGALDYQGILRAGIKDLFGGGDSLQGASTLTMQLIDNIYMPARYARHHNIRYKIVQAKLAEQLENRHPKSWILTSYLNDVPYGTVGGETAFGVGAASQMFFNKPVWQLDLAQEALLAGLPQAPSEYNPFIHPALARQRRHDVLQAMVQSHYITQSQANAADQEGLQVQPNTTYSARQQPYVFDYVEQQLIQRFGLKTVENGGLKVYTTLDLHKQQLAREAIVSHEGGPGQPAAALVSIDPSTGHIVAMASSGSYDQTKFNYAAQAHRQPGSSFKVFVLMTLIHDYGGDPNQTYYNSHYLAAGWLPGYPGYAVHTAEDSYQGNINITKATVLSDNTVFAQLDVDLGPDKVRDTAYAMGITTHLDALPAEAIGGLRIGVTPLEMADAYSTLANGGDHIPATIVSKVVFPDGSSVTLGNPPRTHVFSDGETTAATDVLKQVVTSGTGTAADYGCPAAGKTGTTNDLSNAWFVGYTPQLSTAVWVGYPGGNIPMADGFGGALAAPIWHDYTQAASGSYCGDFPTPAVSWHGTSFVGPHGSSRNSNSGSDNGNGYSGGASPSSGGTSYNGAPPYSPSPQQTSPSSTGTTGGTGTTTPHHGNGHAGLGGGNGNGGVGTGNGNGNGNGAGNNGGGSGGH
jgi:penicillin-binding protein 1A